MTLREDEPCTNAYRGGAAVQFGEDAGVKGKRELRTGSHHPRGQLCKDVMYMQSLLLVESPGTGQDVSALAGAHLQS